MFSLPESRLEIPFMLSLPLMDVVCKKFLLFALLYFKLIDDIRIGLPQHSRSIAWQS